MNPRSTAELITRYHREWQRGEQTISFAAFLEKREEGLLDLIQEAPAALEHLSAKIRRLISDQPQRKKRKKLSDGDLEPFMPLITKAYIRESDEWGTFDAFVTHLQQSCSDNFELERRLRAPRE